MTTIPDFGSVELGAPATSAAPDDWAKAYAEAAGRDVHEATWVRAREAAAPFIDVPQAFTLFTGIFG